MSIIGEYLLKNAKIESHSRVINVKNIGVVGRNIGELQTQKDIMLELFDPVDNISREVSLRPQIIHWKIRLIQKQVEKLLKES